MDFLALLTCTCSDWRSPWLMLLCRLCGPSAAPVQALGSARGAAWAPTWAALPPYRQPAPPREPRVCRSPWQHSVCRCHPGFGACATLSILRHLRWVLVLSASRVLRHQEPGAEGAFVGLGRPSTGVPSGGCPCGTAWAVPSEGPSPSARRSHVRLCVCGSVVSYRRRDTDAATL